VTRFDCIAAASGSASLAAHSAALTDTHGGVMLDHLSFSHLKRSTRYRARCFRGCVSRCADLRLPPCKPIFGAVSAPGVVREIVRKGMRLESDLKSIRTAYAESSSAQQCLRGPADSS
jgi:hypothetical protein